MISRGALAPKQHKVPLLHPRRCGTDAQHGCLFVPWLSHLSRVEEGGSAGKYSEFASGHFPRSRRIYIDPRWMLPPPSFRRLIQFSGFSCCGGQGLLPKSWTCSARCCLGWTSCRKLFTPQREAGRTWLRVERRKLSTRVAWLQQVLSQRQITLLANFRKCEAFCAECTRS